MPHSPSCVHGETHGLSRREWLCSSARMAVAVPLALSAMADRVMAAPGSIVRRDAALTVKPFALSDVRLLSGPCHDGQEVNRKLLHELSADGLLHNFRTNAKLPAAGAPLGGWEKPDCELRGHFTGHYLSACALMYRSAGDEELKKKGDLMVAELAKCQKALGNGYLSAFPSEFLDRLKVQKKVWAPFYTYHKILAGMIDMGTLGGNAQALEVAEGMAQWVGRYLEPIDDDLMQKILLVEWGGMNDSLYRLYELTGKAQYAQWGDRFYKKPFMEPLTLHRDQLRKLHVNTHIPQVLGMAKRYELTSDATSRDIAEFFWNVVVHGRSYATGGTSNNELWLEDPGRLAAEMKADSQECCVSYNMMKLTRHLYTWTGDVRFFDYFERHVFNTRLGTQHPSNGALMYYLPLPAGYWKVFGPAAESCWCCTGTGIEEFGKFGDSIYFHNDDSLFVNLFIASELQWKEKGVRLKQETRFPEAESTRFTLSCQKPAEFTLNLRVPEWATRGGKLLINGKPEPGFGAPSSYIALKRTWRHGDVIEYSLPMSLRQQGLPDDDRLQAVLYGPLVLSADLGPAPKDQIFGDNGFKEGTKPAEVPVIRAASTDPVSWIEKLPGKPLAFQTKGQAQTTPVLPLYQILEQRFNTYWTVDAKKS